MSATIEIKDKPTVDLSAARRVVDQPNSNDRKKAVAELMAQEVALQQQWIDLSANDFMLFARGLIIDGQHGPVQLNKVIRDHQIQPFEDLAPSLKTLRDGGMPDKRRHWWERTKKASKDADLAIVVAWLCVFPTRPFYGQIGAADKEQAKIVKDRLTVLIHLNPWMHEYIEIVKDEIRSVKKMVDGTPMCKFDIKSSDIAGAHGGTPDLLIVNELSHIAKWEFVENLMDNADGVAQGMVLIATNAGYKGTPAYVWRTAAIKGDTWAVHILDRPAAWHSKETIEDAKRRNPQGRYLRLWWGIWVSGKGDALDAADLEAAFVLDGHDEGPMEGWTYIMGIDLGISNDHAGVAVIGVNPHIRRVRVSTYARWNPKEFPGDRVPLQLVMDTIEDLYEIFGCMCAVYDPHQAELMVQQLRVKHILWRLIQQSFSPTNMTEMATAFLMVFADRLIQLFDDVPECTLRNDFGKFDIVQKGYGFRLQATSDASGHADVGTAVISVLPIAVELLEGHKKWLNPDHQVSLNSSIEPMSDEELEETPEALRAIITAEDDPYADAEVNYIDLGFG